MLRLVWRPVLLRFAPVLAVLLGITAPAAAQSTPAATGIPRDGAPAPVDSAPGAPAPVDSAPGEASAARAAVLEVRLSNSSEEPDATFFGALAAQLTVPLRFALPSLEASASRQLAIVYAPERNELSLSYSRVGQETITRSVEAPRDPRQAAQLIALLATNLLTEQVAVPPELPAVTPKPEPQPTPPAVQAPVAAVAVATPRAERIATASLFYPIATNFRERSVLSHFDFALVYGAIGELEGLQLGSVSSVEAEGNGLSINAVFSRFGEAFSGLQFAGVVASARAVRGLQAAGLFSHASAGITGLQMAGLTSIARGRFEGAQLALGASLASESRGAQFSGVFNLANNVSGLQVAPLLNIAGSVRGAQVGLVNIARKVTGTQIGLINIAEDVRGLPVGFVNVTKTGGVHLSAWGSTATHANVGLRLATRHTYTMLTLGYHRTNGKNALGPGLSLGVRIPVHAKVAVDLDVLGEYLFGTRLCCYDSKREERLAHGADRQQFHLRLIPTWIAKPWLSVFVGAGASARVPFAIYSNFAEADRTVRVNPELLLGAAF